MATPSLFGIEHSNRDFSERDAWGKNVFNSAFPVALCNYFLDRKIMANYLDVNKKGFGISEISIHDVYGGNSYSKLFFDFETDILDKFKHLIDIENLSKKL